MNVSLPIALHACRTLAAAQRARLAARAGALFDGALPGVPVG